VVFFTEFVWLSFRCRLLPALDHWHKYFYLFGFDPWK